jgi:hypothetical protein
MKGARCLAYVFTLAVVLMGLVDRAGAVPVFARKYGFRCTMCHVQFPKLNDFGQAFRDNGYRIMGKEAQEKNVFETPTPLALRTSAGYNNASIDNPGGERADVRAFQLNGLDVLSAGLFSDRIGYFMVYTPEIKGSRSVVAQDGTLEMANVVYGVRSAPVPFTVRLGRFEPAYVAFSVKRTLTVGPYDVYDFAGPEGFAMSDTQTGIELATVLRNRVKLAAGWVNGNETQPASDSPSAFYLRASKTLGRGEGQVVGHRLGAFACFGRNRLAGGTGNRENIRRLGVDASLSLGQTNVMAQYVTGRDDAALNTFDPTRDYDFSGGFLEANHSFPHDVLGFARWGWVNTPDEQNQDTKGWTLGLRYYPEMNVAMHVEYFKRKIDHGAADGMSDLDEKMWTVRADFSF